MMSLGAHLGPSWIATNVSDPWSSSALLHEPVTAGNMPPPPYHYPTSLGASSESIPLPSSTATINHSSATTNALDYIFTTLRSRDTHERQGAAQQLRNLVSAARSRLSEDARGDLYGTLTKRVSELGAFNNPAHYRLGAMAAISSTVDLIEASAISRYLTTIRFNLPTNNMEVMEAANLALGHALSSINSLVDAPSVVDFVGHWAIERLEDPTRVEYDRYGAVIIIGSLISHTPSHFYNLMVDNIDKLWSALNDSQRWVREAASDTLGQCLHTLEVRGNPAVTKKLVSALYQTAQEALTSANGSTKAEAVEGSLLCIKKLFETTNELMRPHYKVAAKLVFELTRHRDLNFRRTVFKDLAPILARYDPGYFAETHLHHVMMFLISMIRQERERSLRENGEIDDVLTTIGNLALAESAYIEDYTETIMNSIKDFLRSQIRKNAAIPAPFFFAMGSLAQAVGAPITRYIQDILDLMFTNGLSLPLIGALSQIVTAAPPLLRGVQSRLLNLLSLILVGEPYRVMGAPPHHGYSGFADLSPLATSGRDARMVRTALATLREFDMSGHSLGEFVYNCTLPYLEDDSANTRREATVTCLTIFARDPVTSNTSLRTIELVNAVLDKIMSIAVADPEEGLRADALRHLGPRFDQYLAQPDFVRSLFVAFNDGNFKVRIEATEIIGRCSKLNPAFVMPSLRNGLIQLLTSIELSTQPRSQEEALALLSVVIEAASSLVQGYAVPILAVLLVKIRDPVREVAAKALMCLGKLSRVSGEELGPQVGELMSSVIRQLVTSTSDLDAPKRNAALQALGMVVSNTGSVVEPLVEHTELLSTFNQILRKSSDKATRHEVSRVLGLLGAVDPNKLKQRTELPDDQSTESPTPDSDLDIFNAGVEHGHGSEEYFQHAVVSLLMRALQDANLAGTHHAVVESLIFLLNCGGLQLSRLPQVVPTFLLKIATVSTKTEFYYDQLANLIRAVKKHILRFVPDIIDCIVAGWKSSVTSRPAIMSCMEALCSVLDIDIKTYMPRLLPPILQVLDSEYDGTRQKTLYIKILHFLQLLGESIEEYLRLVIPVVVRMFERRDLYPQARKAAIVTIGQISRKVSLANQSSSIVQSLCRVLSSTHEDELRNTAMDTLSALVIQLGPEYAVFIPSVDRILKQHNINQPLYEKLVIKLLKGEKLAQDLIPDTSVTSLRDEPSSSRPIASNPVHLRRSWQLDTFTTDEEWEHWMKGMAEAFLHEAPSLSIRACKAVAAAEPKFALELFPISFVACQAGLPEDYKRDLEHNFRIAYSSSSLPDHIAHFLLRIAEVMECYHEPLPKDVPLLGQKSYLYGLYAKALHYKETEYFEKPSPTVMESLIDINTRLRQPDSALGALTLARDSWEITREEQWCEKLHRWDDALATFSERSRTEARELGHVQIGTQLGKVRCLHALGQYQDLYQVVQEAWTTDGTQDDRTQLAVLGAAAAWSLQRWDDLDALTQEMEWDSVDRAFYRAILCTHYCHRERALKHINRARDAIDLDVSSALPDGYGRAYDFMVRTQILAELEEVLTYKLDLSEQPERQASMKRTWLKRLEGCQADVEIWRRMLSIHSLVATPIEDQEARIKFANLCRNHGRMNLADKTLAELMGIDEALDPTIDVNFYTHPMTSPAVSYAHLKFRWASTGQNPETVLSDMRTFAKGLGDALGITAEGRARHQVFVGPTNTTQEKVSRENLRLLARCYFKQGEWQRTLDSRNQVAGESRDVSESFRRATELDTNWYKAWHFWAEANFIAIQYQEKADSKVSKIQNVVAAVTGYFKSVILSSLSSKNYALQDTLRILALWFKWGDDPDVEKAMSEGFASLNIDTWLDVLPQIIARIGTNMGGVRDQIKLLLASVGAAHPQALLYPLSVAAKSDVPSRVTATNDILDSMRDHAPTLVDQTMAISRELIRLAILWPEIVHAGLDDASQFMRSKDTEIMVDRLERMHAVIGVEAETMCETNFLQQYGRDLSVAYGHLKRYCQYGDINDNHLAWDYYSKVYRRIEKALAGLHNLKLSSCAPALLAMTDLELAMPGSYKAGQEVVRIKCIDSSVPVINSKQRPRRIELTGSNGKRVHFLLKGHEDMRQDARAMQLFGLINRLLSQNPNAAKRGLRMRRYPVIPLSSKTGMVQWVENSDTMHTLLDIYRKQRNIPLNIEHRWMTQFVPKYDQLPPLQKIEVFHHVHSKDKGHDLYRILWLRSRNSESWLERRINYTRSLGVSAVAGYILGLGDRHPSNLLFDRYTGEVVHIDFGDCFEVAQQRSRYPEKVPFRLTRMLVNAMEVGGVRGTFRIASEIVMETARDNRASLFTLLEAFVHDPLIGWRLIEGRGRGRARNQDKESLDDGPNGVIADADSRNTRAIKVINRIHSKLEGLDFNNKEPLDVHNQMERLIVQATDVANICVLYVGWCPFW